MSAKNKFVILRVRRFAPERTSTDCMVQDFNVEVLSAILVRIASGMTPFYVASRQEQSSPIVKNACLAGRRWPGDSFLEEGVSVLLGRWWAAGRCCRSRPGRWALSFGVKWGQCLAQGPWEDVSSEVWLALRGRDGFCRSGNTFVGGTFDVYLQAASPFRPPVMDYLRGMLREEECCQAIGFAANKAVLRGDGRRMLREFFLRPAEILGIVRVRRANARESPSRRRTFGRWGVGGILERPCGALRGPPIAGGVGGAGRRKPAVFSPRSPYFFDGEVHRALPAPRGKYFAFECGFVKRRANASYAKKNPDHRANRASARATRCDGAKTVFLPLPRPSRKHAIDRFLAQKLPEICREYCSPSQHAGPALKVRGKRNIAFQFTYIVLSMNGVGPGVLRAGKQVCVWNWRWSERTCGFVEARATFGDFRGRLRADPQYIFFSGLWCISRRALRRTS